MKIDYLDVYGVDPKQAATKFMEQNASPLHIFPMLGDVLKAMDDIRTGGEGIMPCSVHNHGCAFPKEHIHVAVAGFPCAPYSAQRARRFLEGSAWGCKVKWGFW